MLFNRIKKIALYVLVLISFSVKTINAQVFDKIDVPEINLNISNPASNVKVAMNGNGEMVVVYDYFQSPDRQIRFNIISSSGNISGEVLVDNNLGAMGYPEVSFIDNTKFVISYSSQNEIYARRYFINQSAIDASPILVNQNSAKIQKQADVVGLQSGGFVVTWVTEDLDVAGTDGVYARIFDTNGNPTIGEFQVNNSAFFNQNQPKIAAQTSGAFVIVYQSPDVASSEGVMIKRFNADGTQFNSENRINDLSLATNQNRPDIAMDNSGNQFIVWTSQGQDGDSGGIFGRKINSSNSTVGSEFQINTTGVGNQDYASIAMDTDGDFIVTWSSNHSGQVEVYGQRFNSSLQKVGPEFKTNSSGNEFNYSSVSMRNQDLAVVATENIFSGDIFYQRIGLVPNRKPIPSSNMLMILVPEDTAVGPPIYLLPVSDPDSSQQLNFTITAGNPGGIFGINSSTGELFLNTSLDFEMLPGHTLNITITDNGTPAKDTTIQLNINLENRNEAKIEVYGNSQLISNGDVSPTTNDGTDFQTIYCGNPNSFAFDIKNTGDDNLIIKEISFSSDQDGFKETSNLQNASIIKNATDILNLHITTGIKSGLTSDTVWIKSNSYNADSVFYFVIKYNGSISPKFVMASHLPSQVQEYKLITNGSTTPNFTDSTNFGLVGLNLSKKLSCVYTNECSASSPVQITNITFSGPNPNKFSANFNSNPVVYNALGNFDIVFTSSVTGIFDAIVTITTNDPNASPFTFSVQAEAIDCASNMFTTNLPKRSGVCVGDDKTIGVNTAITSTITWYRDGNLLGGYTGNTYGILSATPAMEAYYYAVATNQCGVFKSDSTLLLVSSLPPSPSQTSFLKPTETFCMFSNATIESYALDVAKYTWYRNNVLLPNEKDSVIYLSPAKMSDAGTYTCVFENGCGSVTAPTPTIVSVSTCKLDPQLNFNSLFKYYGESKFNLDPKSYSSGKIHFTIVSGSSITIDTLGRVKILSAGNTVIKIKQDSTNVFDMDSVTATIYILKARPEVEFGSPGFLLTDVNKTPQYRILNDYDGIVWFQQLSDKDTIANIDSVGIITPLHEGKFKIRANFEPTQNYEGFSVIGDLYIFKELYAPIALDDSISVIFKDTFSLHIVQNDSGITAQINPASVDLNPFEDGEQKEFIYNSIGRFYVDTLGNIKYDNFTNSTGTFICRYLVSDKRKKVSNIAEIRLTIDLSDEDKLGDLIVPELLTPNGDNLNDRFVIGNINPKANNTLYVYDKKSNLIYQKENYNNDWDLTDVYGNPLEENTYYFYFEEFNERNRKQKGSFLLKR